jgi:hypothetical protein
MEDMLALMVGPLDRLSPGRFKRPRRLSRENGKKLSLGASRGETKHDNREETHEQDFRPYGIVRQSQDIFDMPSPNFRHPILPRLLRTTIFPKVSPQNLPSGGR